MKNHTEWKPSKVLYDERSGTFRTNPAGIYGGSYHMVTVQLASYIPIIRDHLFGDLLDCGCGLVPYYEVYKSNVSTVTCVDWDQKNVFLDSVCDLNNPLPFDDRKFDSILLADVIAHIRNPESLIREMARVLKPGGKLVIFSPFFYWINEAPYDFQRLTEYAYRAYFEQANLSVAEIFPYGGRRDIFIDLLNKRFASGFLNRLICRLSDLIRETGFLRKSNERSKKLFPLGYCIVANKPV